MLKNFCRIIILLTGVILTSELMSYAQVEVIRSRDKVVISGKPYYIHIVKKGETAYSISKAYGITVEQLVKENPDSEKGIKEGQALRLPIVENIPEQKERQLLFQPRKDESRYIYHKLVPGETVYSLAKKYGVSENEIVESNPGAEINKLPVGAEIAIPKRQFTSSTTRLEQLEDGYISHKVQRGESISSIAEKYGTTVREIRRINRGLIFPRVDDYIRVPVSRITEPVVPDLAVADTTAGIDNELDSLAGRPIEYTEVRNLRGTYNIALLLPLYFEQNARRTEIDSSQVIKGKPVKKIVRKPDDWIYEESAPFIELYQGVLIAADTLRSLGVNINLHVYDIQSDTVGVKNLIESGELRDMDLIIGPIYSHNLSIVSDYASSRQIPVISPVSLMSTDVLDDNPYLFLVNPSLSVAQERIAQIAKAYADDNFILIYSDTAKYKSEIRQFKSYLFRELTTEIPYEEIRFKEFLFYSRSALSNDSINRLGHAMSENSNNIILIASEDRAVLSESLMDINTLSKKYPVKVIGYPAMRDLYNLDPKNYFDIGIELLSPYWIDYSRRDVINFNRAFRSYFFTEPEEISFAWLGYDITYYFLSGLALNGRRFISNPQIHNPDLLSTEFDFRRDRRRNGFENHKLYLIKYTRDMEVELVDESMLVVDN